jgi:hypothetical protein
MTPQPFRPSLLFSFLIIQNVGRTPWTGDQPVARPLPTHRTTQTQDKRTQTSKPGLGFEPMILVFELANYFSIFPILTALQEKIAVYV